MTLTLDDFVVAQESVEASFHKIENFISEIDQLHRSALVTVDPDDTSRLRKKIEATGLLAASESAFSATNSQVDDGANEDPATGFEWNRCEIAGNRSNGRQQTISGADGAIRADASTNRAKYEKQGAAVFAGETGGHGRGTGKVGNHRRPSRSR